VSIPPAWRSRSRISSVSRRWKGGCASWSASCRADMIPSGLRYGLARLSLCAAALVAPGVAAAQLPPPVRSALAAAGIPAAGAALFVQDPGPAAPALAYHASRPMTPASTIKLVTSYAALDLLGPSFTWKTEAYADGPIRDGVLEGDLVLRGTGDPKLT